MDKKNLKWYEAPAMELINMNVEGQLLAGSSGGVVGDSSDISGGNDGSAEDLGF